MILTFAVAAILLLGFAWWSKRASDHRLLERSSITPEELHALLEAKRETLLYDVRLPLDLLADSEIIPGARRIPPQDVRENPELIPRDRETVVYCTCPSDKTSRSILRRARKAGFSRIKFLRGGLDGWKAKGYSVEPYTESFHLDTKS